LDLSSATAVRFDRLTLESTLTRSVHLPSTTWNAITARHVTTHLLDTWRMKEVLSQRSI